MLSGRDTITDLEPADVLILTSIPTMTTRAALTAAAAQVGPNVVITIDANNSITLENFTLAQLAASDVRFAPIVGTEGDDVLNGSQGNDVIYGGAGDDLLNGAEGDDQLFGEDGSDVLNGGPGGDSFVPGSGNDTVDGGDSLNDYIDFGAGATSGAVVDLAAGTATNDGRGGIDAITNVEHVYGTSFGDTLGGDAGSNQLHGFMGNDALSGRDGADNVHGYEGDDVVNGGTGDDFMTGGAGDDLFVFAAGDGIDTIQDFSAGAGTDDIIDLQALAGFDSFADVLAATTDNGFDATIDLGGGNRITLSGVTESALHADDFLI
jgi:Ca2+-binding RTX toxin-like protein